MTNNVQYIQQRGECCGFAAWIDRKNPAIIHWSVNVCGKGIVATGQFPYESYQKVIDSINFDSLNFDEWGEAIISINEDVEILVDKYEVEITPDVFQLRWRG